MAAKVVSVAVLLLVLGCAQPGLAKVHEVLWDTPGNGLELPSISTAKCGDVIRFRCPLHATHGIYKLESTNYNGTCPESFDVPMVGEVLSAPTKACDYSLTVGDGPDFFITSQVDGACKQNLKVYVHAVCLKNDNTFASGMLSGLAALPSSLPKLLPSGLFGLSSGSGAAAGASGMPGGADSTLGGLLSGQPTTLGAANTGVRRSNYEGVDAVLENAKQNAAAGVQPALAKAAAAAAAAIVLALAL